MRKDGSAFDLPIALSLLGATGRLTSRERLRRYLVIGELALDGRVRGIKGALPTALHARAAKYDGLVLPRENAMEAAVVGDGVAILPVDTLREALEFFEGAARVDADNDRRRHAVRTRRASTTSTSAM